MSDSGDFQLDAFAVDVRALLSTTVASLYSHLITRPTGRAVRMAIESQLEEIPGPAISMVDFSSVAVLDYSCADEVVAKLLLGLRDGGALRSDVFVCFRGLQSFHREPVEAVLERHSLYAVVEADSGGAELMGPVPAPEGALWGAVEEVGQVPGPRLEGWLRERGLEGADLEHLVASRSLFRHPFRGDIYALSELAELLAERPGDPSTPETPPEPNARDQTS